MRAPFRFVGIPLLLATLLAACAMEDPGNRFPPLTFQHLPDIGLDVGEIQVEQAYVTPGPPAGGERNVGGGAGDAPRGGAAARPGRGEVWSSAAPGRGGRRT